MARRLPLTLAILLTACGTAHREFNDGRDGGDETGTSEDGGGFTGSLSDGSSSPKTGCQFVDILFLVDNSASMLSKQQKLAAAWPQFVDAMFTALPAGVDLHVGLTTTSFFVGSTSEGTCNCASCNSDADITAHFVKPGDQNDGENGGQGRLFVYQGKSFYSANTSSASDKQGLSTWFSSAATAVGQVSSSYEFPSAGVAYVTDPANAAANKDFLRDEGAVLLLVFLTDEPDKSYVVDTPKHYHDMIAGAKTKCGGDKCIITAGVINPCVPSSNQFLWQLMTSFGNQQPAWADINAAASAYSMVVGTSLAQVVQKTCENISPPK